MGDAITTAGTEEVGDYELGEARWAIRGLSSREMRLRGGELEDLEIDESTKG